MPCVSQGHLFVVCLKATEICQSSKVLSAAHWVYGQLVLTKGSATLLDTGNFTLRVV